MILNDPLLIDTCSILYPSKCCDQILREFTIDNECLKSMISKSLGYGIIVGSSVVKLPQVLKIVSAKSGAGISVLSVLLELLAVTFAAAYSIAKHFPFSAWGEALFLSIETAAIVFFVLFYDANSKRSLAFIIIYSSFAYLLMSGLTPINVLWMLQAANLPLVLFAKLIQALKNYQNGHTGQLSAITMWLMSLGAFVRIFTSWKETNDLLVVLIYVVATFANVILLFQITYYWNVTNKFLEKTSKKKSN